MATITLSYDSDNASIRKLLEVIVAMGGVLSPSINKSSLEMSLDDVAAGRVYEAQDAADLFKQCGINV